MTTIEITLSGNFKEGKDYGDIEYHVKEIMKCLTTSELNVKTELRQGAKPAKK